MSSKNGFSRITITIKKIDPERLKKLSAVSGKNTNELVGGFIRQLLSDMRCLNEETINAMEEVVKRIDLIFAEDIGDLFKKLGL